MLIKCAICSKCTIDTDDDLVLNTMLNHVMDEHWTGGRENHGWSEMFFACWRDAVDYIRQYAARKGLMISIHA